MKNLNMAPGLTLFVKQELMNMSSKSLALFLYGEALRRGLDPFKPHYLDMCPALNRDNLVAFSYRQWGLPKRQRKMFILGG